MIHHPRVDKSCLLVSSLFVPEGTERFLTGRHLPEL